MHLSPHSTIAITAPAPRPALPEHLQRGHQTGLALSDGLLESIRVLTDGRLVVTPGVTPTDAAITAAVTALAELAPQASAFTATAAAALGPAGAYRVYVGGRSNEEWVQRISNSKQMRDVRGAAADATASLQRLRATGSYDAWVDTHQTLLHAWTGANHLAHQLVEVHGNRFSSTSSGWAGDVVLQFDRDGDGSVDIAAEHVSDRGHGGGSTFGVLTNGVVLLTAADAQGDRNGAASAPELARLAAPFDADRDGWLSIRDEERVAQRHPSQPATRP